MANRGPWTGDRIVAAIRAWAERTGQPPGADDWRKATSDTHPSTGGDPRLWFLERGDRCRGVRAHSLGERSAYPPEPAVRPGLVTGPDPPVGGLTLVGSAVM